MAFKGLKDFQPLRVRSNHNLSLWSRFGCGFWVISHIAWSKTCRWQVFSERWQKFERFTRWCYQGVCHRIEGKLPSITHGGDNGRRCEEVHGLDVPVIPGAEIPVEGREDS